MLLEFIRNNYVLIISGALGTLGFCLFFRVRRDKLIYGCLGGLLTSLFYCICNDCGMTPLMRNLIPAIVGTLYAELIARVVKAPATVFLIPAVIPLTPGGTLYYTMSAIVDGDMERAKQQGEITILVALGIAVGIVFVSVIFYQMTNWNYRIRTTRNKPWQITERYGNKDENVCVQHERNR